MDRTRQLLLDISSIPEPSLWNFVPGSNQELLNYLTNFDLSEEKIVYIWGETGCGKSHLLKATVNAIVAKGGLACYCEPGQLPQTYLAETHDLLAIDNVGMLDAERQIELFDLFNRAKEEKSRLLMCGGNVPSALNIRPDVSTRISWGLIFRVHSLSDRDKREALLAHAQSRGFTLNSEIADYLLHHTERNMSSLMWLLDTLDHCSLETKRPITLPLLREILSK